MGILKKINQVKQKIVPVKFNMSGWGNANFLSKTTLEKIFKSLEQSPKSSTESAATDTKHSYNEFATKTLKLLKRELEYFSGKGIGDKTAITYVNMIKKLLEYCEEYLSEPHNPLHSANRIKGIKKIKSLCIKSLKDISADSIKGWTVPPGVVTALSQKW